MERRQCLRRFNLSICATAIVYYFNKNFLFIKISCEYNPNFTNPYSVTACPFSGKAFQIDCYCFPTQLPDSQLYRINDKLVQQVPLTKKFFGLPRKIYFPVHALHLHTNAYASHTRTRRGLIELLDVFLFSFRNKR